MSTLSELLYYCKESNSFGALMFTGKWGCGKTYLIDNELSKELGQDYIIIRISLFGESSIDSINKKVQKAYFQNLMLHMGSYVEDVAQLIPSVSEEQALKLAESTEKITGKVANISEKINTSKVGGLVRFVSGIAKKVPGVEKIFSLSPSEYISVEKTIADKKVILVFDDLERTNLDEIDVMGCINEYCENKQIKTIIVANEEKILEKCVQTKSNQQKKENDPKNDGLGQSTGGKLGYSEIKEKIITRTVKNIADYEKIIAQIIDEFVADEPFYNEFLQEHKIDLINVFNCGNSENIRSIKCAIQDFQRVFIELHKKGIYDELKTYFQTFAAFMFHFKDGKISKSEQYGYLFSDYDIEKEYPGFFIKRYMLPSVKKWIVEGEWDSDGINSEINKMIEEKKATEPKDIVRNADLISLDEDTIEAGFPEVVSLAYAGELSVDEYIILLRNLLWSRNISYILPVEIDMDKLMVGVQKCLDALCESDEPDSRVRSMIHPDNLSLLNTEEHNIYQKICEFRDKSLQMFAINKRKYLNALNSGDMKNLFDCENKRYNVFDKEMANAVMKCYKVLSNADRQVFNGIFKKMWGSNIRSQDLLKENSILGLEELKAMIQANRSDEQDNNYGLKAALSEAFIQIITEIIDTLKAQD
ncbi:MAG TPA: P-loop NTPase fold protein [Clostridia bacterium]|nr:P-loop NTPase fold protein [Clostridia bacterium]